MADERYFPAIRQLAEYEVWCNRRSLEAAGELTAEEFAIVKTHVAIGGRILSGSSFPLLKMAEQIARYHHEHWDGSGYLSMKGDAIPHTARLSIRGRKSNRGFVIVEADAGRLRIG